MIGEIVTTLEQWDQRLYGLAELAASWSKDPKRKVGSSVVTADRLQFSLGYNGFPRGTPDTKQHLMDDEIRQMLMVHGEINAIINAPFATSGCTLYATKFPCHVCAGIIANSRIIRLVCPAPDFDHPRWGPSYKTAWDVLSEGIGELVSLAVSQPVVSGK